MALQSFVNKEYALGVPGDMVNPGEGQNVFTPVNPMAEGDVNVGSFVFPGSDPYAKASNAAESVPAGNDSYAIAATPSSGSVVSGSLTASNEGSAIQLETTIGAANETGSGQGTLSIPVGTGFVGTVSVGGVAVATVAEGGEVTLGSTLEATGTNSKLIVSNVTYAGDTITISLAVEWTATATAPKVMGFVMRVQMYPNYNLTSAGTLTVQSGSALSVAVRGDFYAISKTAAEIGQKVFASTTDGSISTATAGGSVSGHVETDWEVKRGGAAGELIVIGRQ